MHGLINRSLQCFVQDTYGAPVWTRIAGQLGLPSEGFDALRQYDDALTTRAIAVASAALNKTRSALLEDLGTYLVTNPNREAVRRLLRFSGETFVDFLLTLEDVPDRARLALPDLVLPDIMLTQHDAETFDLHLRYGLPGAGHLLAGVLRGMADDYGALVMMEVEPMGDDCDRLRLTVHDTRFATGRSFALTQAAL